MKCSKKKRSFIVLCCGKLTSTDFKSGVIGLLLGALRIVLAVVILGPFEVPSQDKMTNQGEESYSN